MGIPFIHLIDTPVGNYVYDVNKNQIIEIDIDMYNALKNMLNGDMNVDEDKVLLWQSYGYFSSNHSNISKHPDTDYIEYYVKSHLSALTLQVTQQCNFRCEYCIYSGNYMDRKHSSLIMTKEVVRLMKEKGYKIGNVDSVICAQKPKLADFIFKMRKNVANVLETDIENISIKATTTEHLGFEGREEGISSQAVVLLDKI